MPKAQDEREMYVVKSNDLIRKSRYSLTLQQQKIVLYAISKIKPHDNIFTEYTFKIIDFCRVCGLSMSGSYYYDSIKSDLNELLQRSWITLNDGTEMTISWIGDAKIKQDDGTISFRFNPNMAPYLFELKERYTQYKLESVLWFKSTYSIRLYELLRSYTTQKNLEEYISKDIEMGLDELRSYLGAENKYPSWGDFERYILRKAKDEINSYSKDIHIEYDVIKEGRQAKKVRFTISTYTFSDYMTAEREKEKRLGKAAAK